MLTNGKRLPVKPGETAAKHNGGVSERLGKIIKKRVQAQDLVLTRSWKFSNARHYWNTGAIDHGCSWYCGCYSGAKAFIWVLPIHCYTEIVHTNDEFETQVGV